jgi:hypothetical protein
MIVKPLRLVLAAISLCIVFSSSAQSVIVPDMASLAQDTVVKNQLISSLNGFLGQKDGPNKDNRYVLKEDLPETSALLDEIKGVEQSNKYNIKNFYKCHLANVVKLEAGDYLVQFSYLGIADSVPVMRACFRVMAKARDGKFYFSSPLKWNTISWKTRKTGNVSFHYKAAINLADANEYLKTVNFYDRKLNAPAQSIDFYYCDNFPEALQITGIDYKSDYNGVKADNLSSHENGQNLMVAGGHIYQYSFDTHDLWHDRLRNVMSADIINRPVDEGCAYLYGGSWGFDWLYVLAKFKQYAADNPNADWLSLYIDTKNFVEGDKSMKVPYVLNSLIVQKIEKEKGFAPVMELLGCGKRETGDENYFKALEKITGITKTNFNAAMWALIKKS